MVIHNLLYSTNKKKSGYQGAAICGGDMVAEKSFFETDKVIAFSDVDGFDISKISLKRYKPTGLNFHSHALDCNYMQLKQDYYDLIVMSDGAHHVYNLGNLFYQSNKALKDTGVLYMYEWIIPQRMLKCITL